MSTAPKNRTCPAGPESGITTRDGVEVMINRLDKKWIEIKKLLKTEESPPVEDSPCLGAGGRERMAGEEPGEDWWQSLPFHKANFDINSEETDALLDGAKSLDPDHEMQERLAKVQWQNRGLIVYSVICTIMFLYLLLSVFLSNDGFALNQTKPDAKKETLAGAAPETAGPSPTLSDALPLSAPAPEAGKASSQGAAPPASPQKTGEQPVGQEASKALGTDKTPEVPQAEYVGSITSNKYHYRTCIWAQYIIPRKEMVFHSVAEAQKEGYVPCPTCRPPVTDAVRTSARDR